MAKLRFRILLCVVVCTLLLSTPFLTVSMSDFFSFTIERSDVLDLSTGRISGDRAQYFIDFTSLSSDWADNIIAYRELTAAGSIVLERVNFFVRSYTRPARDQLQLLFAIYVIDRHAITEDAIPFEIVSRSRDFIFAIRYGTNGFVNPLDINYFNIRLMPMNTAIRMRRFIILPEPQMIDHRDTAFVYGVPMNSQIRRIDNVPFIQLREAAEIMGFNVAWIERTGFVFLTRGLFRDSFRVSSTMLNDHRNIPMRLIDGRTYVSVAYFSIVLNCHISFDQRTNNIFISAR